jgi:5-methyltetrahydrofolate--homocysteine methyltransferase
METTLSSKTKTVVIGPDRPFVLIGERINPTGRRKLAEEMSGGDFSRVRADALAQVEAGATILDVNAGVPGADEASIMRQAAQLLADTVDVPLCFDSANPAAMEAALRVYAGKALINSTTGEEGALARILPLAKKYGAAVIALCSDEHGPSPDPLVRLAVARKIAARAADYGVPLADLVFDPLVMTLGADSHSGKITLETIRLLRQDLGVNMTLGASNVSFGLPDRPALTAAFLSMAMVLGLDSAITNPLEPAVRIATLAGDLLLAHDDYSMRWIKNFRKREKARQQAAG